MRSDCQDPVSFTITCGAQNEISRSLTLGFPVKIAPSTPHLSEKNLPTIHIRSTLLPTSPNRETIHATSRGHVTTQVLLNQRVSEPDREMFWVNTQAKLALKTVFRPEAMSMNLTYYLHKKKSAFLRIALETLNGVHSIVHHRLKHSPALLSPRKNFFNDKKVCARYMFWANLGFGLFWGG